MVRPRKIQISTFTSYHKKGTVLIFDNYYKNKRSRIVEIDIKSKVVGSFSNKDYKFFTIHGEEFNFLMIGFLFKVPIKENI